MTSEAVKDYIKFLSGKIFKGAILQRYSYSRFNVNFDAKKIDLAWIIIEIS